MSKVAHYLQEHLVGEVTTSPEARRFFSTDASVFTVTPSIVVYPRSENDIRKTARFAWQLAERGRPIPITARGSGSDLAGAAIGSGIVMVFPAHLNHILEFDSKSGTVVIEPGTNYAKLQQTLQTHGRFLPPFPASIEISSIGGAIANNAAGEKSVKYGSTRDFVKALRVVLANGEVVETTRLNKRDLSKKLGLSSFEGEIYRALDTLIEENKATIENARPAVSKNTAGYNVWDVLKSDGSFDLTPLLVGSQGTLGIVSEAVLTTEAHNPNTTLIAAFFDDVGAAEEAIQATMDHKNLPSAVEMVDGNLLQFVDQHNPNQLKGTIDKPFPKLVVLIEFDDAGAKRQKRLTARTTKILDRLGVRYVVETEGEQKDRLWKIRHAAATVVTHSKGGLRAVPVMEDAIVPTSRFKEYLEKVYELFERYHMPVAVWGHAGNANLHIQPFLDLSQVGDRQRALKISDEYYHMVLSLGGSTSGEHNDGRLRAPYLETMFGAEVYQLFGKIKQIFDPHGILNPGVKMHVTIDDIRPLLSSSYEFKWHSFLPRAS